MRVTYPDQRWSVAHNTATSPTDAYGTIEFLGGPHPTKAQVRITGVRVKVMKIGILINVNINVIKLKVFLQHIWQNDTLTTARMMIFFSRKFTNEHVE